MSITLNGQTYATVRDMDGKPLVIRQSGKMWRVASREQSAKILAGLSCRTLGNVVPLCKMPDTTYI